MKREDLIKKFEELKKCYYDEYTFSHVEESLDMYTYLKSLNIDEMSDEELRELLIEYDFIY